METHPDRVPDPGRWIAQKERVLLREISSILQAKVGIIANFCYVVLVFKEFLKASCFNSKWPNTKGFRKCFKIFKTEYLFRLFLKKFFL